MILTATRKELVQDLPQPFREQNYLAEISDLKLIDAWKRYGIHAGTWDWDTVEIHEE